MAGYVLRWVGTATSNKLYALDTKLEDLGSPTKADLLNAMEGHIPDCAELICTYERAR